VEVGGINTSAYYVALKIAAVKCFIVYPLRISHYCSLLQEKTARNPLNLNFTIKNEIKRLLCERVPFCKFDLKNY